MDSLQLTIAALSLVSFLFTTPHINHKVSPLTKAIESNIDRPKRDDYWLEKITTYDASGKLEVINSEQFFFYKNDRLDSTEFISYWHQENEWTYASRITEQLAYKNGQLTESRMDYFNDFGDRQCTNPWNNKLCKVRTSMVIYKYNNLKAPPTLAIHYSRPSNIPLKTQTIHHFTWNNQNQLIRDSVVATLDNLPHNNRIISFIYDSIGNVACQYENDGNFRVGTVFQSKYFNPLAQTRDQRILNPVNSFVTGYYEPFIISPNISNPKLDPSFRNKPNPIFSFNRVRLLKQVVNKGIDRTVYTYSIKKSRD